MNIGDKLKKLHKFSCIYAKTIESILKNPKKSTLVYNSWVAGSGCILFSKILELFGFVKASGHDTTKQLRYAILTTTTIPPNSGYIEAIKDKFNSIENINGEIIQVIIFSKLLSEGISFNNVRSIHIQTPHWNYSETSQVIARGLRLNSHADLLAAGIDPVVDIYQHVATAGAQYSDFSPNIDIHSSLNLYKYEVSEMKDFSIKSIEHVLKESAVDCPIFYGRNHTDNPKNNNSRICEYMSCDYKCDGGNRITRDDFSTYNLYYSGNEEKRLLTFLIHYFRSKFSISIAAIRKVRELLDITDFKLLAILDKIISENHIINNAYGFPCYVKEKDSVLFLTENLSSDNDFLSLSYTQSPIAINETSFSSAVGELITKQLVEDIKSAQTYDDFQKYMRVLEPAKQRNYLELALMATVQTSKVDMILEYFNGSYDAKTKNYYRIENDAYELKDGVWQNTTVKVTKAEGPTKINPLGIYGEYNKESGNFWIRKSDKEVTDSRKKSSGLNCSSYKEIDLAALCIELGMTFDDVHVYNPIKEELIQKRISEIDGLTREQLVKRLEQYRTFFAKLPPDMSLEQLKHANLFITMPGKKKDLCEIVLQFLTKNGFVTISDKTQQYGATKKDLV